MFNSRSICMMLFGACIFGAASGVTGAAEPGQFGYGQQATQDQIAGWDIDVRGDDATTDCLTVSGQRQ